MTRPLSSVRVSLGPTIHIVVRQSLRRGKKAIALMMGNVERKSCPEEALCSRRGEPGFELQSARTKKPGGTRVLYKKKRPANPPIVLLC